MQFRPCIPNWSTQHRTQAISNMSDPQRRKQLTKLPPLKRLFLKSRRRSPTPPPVGPQVQVTVILPQELIDHIVDFLHNDKQALIACSLISQAFLSASRFHLFSHLDLHIREEEIWHRFHIFITSSSPSVMFIQSLSIDMMELYPIEQSDLDFE